LLIERDNRKIPAARQAELLETSRSTVHYKPVMDLYNLELIRLIDEQYTRTPFLRFQKDERDAEKERL